MKLRLTNILNRNIVLFTGGLAGVGHETLLTHAERPTLLILFAAMMGLPAFLSPIGKALADTQVSEHDRRKKERDDKEAFEAAWKRHQAEQVEERESEDESRSPK